MKVAVLFGGVSEERDVSIASGAQVVKGLRQAGHDVVAVDTASGPLDAAAEHALLTRGISPAPPDAQTLDLLRGSTSSSWRCTGEPAKMARCRRCST